LGSGLVFCAKWGHASFSSQKYKKNIFHEYENKEGKMKTKSKLVFVIGTLIGIFFIILIISQLSSALEPRLLWKKKLPQQIYAAKVAAESGDIIVNMNREQIFKFDRKGNTTAQEGPNLERIFHDVDIASNGEVYTYVSTMKMEYALERNIDPEKDGYDDRVHYCQKGGKEIWNKRIVWDEEVQPFLSPDGQAVLAVLSDGRSVLINTEGKVYKLKEKFNWGYTLFSPDSSHFAIGRWYWITLLDRNGNIVWEKGSPQDLAGPPLSISENARYFSVYPCEYDESTFHNGKVYDKSGNLAFDKLGILSGDGKRIILIEESKIKILALPDQNILREYPVKIIDVPEKETIYPAISYNGRHIAVFGKDNSSKSNFFVFDVDSNTSWSTLIDHDVQGLYITRDGKYLLVVTNNSLFYYQLF